MDRESDLSRIRCVSITQTVFGVLSIGGVAGMFAYTNDSETVVAGVFNILQVILLLMTGIFGIVLVSNARNNAASSSQFLISVVCNSILAAISIASLIAYIAFAAIIGIAFAVVGLGIFATVFIVVSVFMMLFSILFISLAIMAAKAANRQRVQTGSGMGHATMYKA